MHKTKLSRGQLRGVEIRCTNELKGKCSVRVREICRVFLTLLDELDDYTLTIYPVFELIDREVRLNPSKIVIDEEGYKFVRPDGFVLSRGETMRDWLIDHISTYGEKETDYPECDIG